MDLLICAGVLSFTGLACAVMGWRNRMVYNYRTSFLGPEGNFDDYMKLPEYTSMIWDLTCWSALQFNKKYGFATGTGR